MNAFDEILRMKIMKKIIINSTQNDLLFLKQIYVAKFAIIDEKKIDQSKKNLQNKNR